MLKVLFLFFNLFLQSILISFIISGGEKMKEIKIFLLIIVIFLIVTSCISSNPGENESYDYVILKMDLSNVINNNSNHQAKDKNSENPYYNSNRIFDTDYYLIYQNIISGEETTYLHIDSTEVELPLTTDSVYVIALAKDNGSYIETVGFLGEPNLGLICIPTPDSTTIVDMGRLSQEISEDGLTILKPDVTTEEFANSLNFSFETLQMFGIVDVTFKNMINPDSNKNGIIDFEEGLKWDIYPGYAADNNGNLYGTTWLVFKMKNGYPNFINGKIVDAILEISEDSNDVDILHHSSNDISENGKIIGWFFEINGKKGNCNGNYVLKLYEEGVSEPHIFYFDDLRFYNPSDANEGFIFPQAIIKAYSDGKVEKVGWNWRIKKGDELLDASSELIKLLTNKNGNNRGLTIDLLPLETFYDQFYEISEIELGAYDVKWPHNIFIPELEGFDFTVSRIIDVSDKDYWTLLDVTHLKFDPLPIGTMFEMLAPYDYLPTPSNYTPQATILSLLDHKEKLAGIKYNLYYYNLINSEYRDLWLTYFPEDYWYFEAPIVNGLIRFIPPYVEFTNIEENASGTIKLSWHYSYPYFSKYPENSWFGHKPAVIEGYYDIIDSTTLALYDNNKNHILDLNVKLYENGNIEIENIRFIDINGDGLINEEDTLNLVYSDFIEQ